MDFISATGATEFTITDIKRYIPVVSLSTQDNEKLLKQLESGFKRIINWNKYKSKLTKQTQNRYLDYLIDPSFQRVNRIFILLFENEDDINVHTGYFLPKIEKKMFVIDGTNFFDEPIENDKITYDNIRKTATGLGDDYTTGCLLDYIYFKENYMINSYVRSTFVLKV